MSREDPHFRLRLPIWLHEHLRAAAAAEKRSINSEIVSRLEASAAMDRTRLRTGMPLPSAAGLQAAMDAVKFMAEHQKTIEEWADKNKVDVPWPREEQE